MLQPKIELCVQLKNKVANQVNNEVNWINSLYFWSRFSSLQQKQLVKTELKNNCGSLWLDDMHSIRDWQIILLLSDARIVYDSVCFRVRRKRTYVQFRLSGLFNEMRLSPDSKFRVSVIRSEGGTAALNAG